MDKASIGKRISRQREKLSMTRDEFSEKIGISSQLLAQIENATKGMSAETLYKICATFEISADYILLGQQPRRKGSRFGFNKTNTSRIYWLV